VDDGVNQSTPDQVKVYVMDRVIVKEMINPGSGGALSISDGNLAGLQLAIPPGALTADTTIGIGQDFSLPPLNGRTIQIPASFEPAGLSFALPVSVMVPYDAKRYKNPDKLKVYLYDESIGQWIEVPIVRVDQVYGLVTVNITHFSSLALIEDEEETSSKHEIDGGFGCGMIKNVSRPGNPPTWPLDLFLLGTIVLWLSFRNTKCLRFLPNH